MGKAKTRSVRIPTKAKALQLYALEETIRRLELSLHNERMEVIKARRELVAARLLIAIHRVRDDPRISTSVSRDEEMNDITLKILTERQVELPTYQDARQEWLAKTQQGGQSA